MGSYKGSFNGGHRGYYKGSIIGYYSLVPGKDDLGPT